MSLNKGFGNSLVIFLGGGVVVGRVRCGQSWELEVVDRQEGSGYPENMGVDAGSSTAIGTLSPRPALKYRVEPKLSVIQDC